VGQPLLFTGWGVADSSPAWNWGDGSPSAYGNPMPHAFQQPGAYGVIFTGTDNLCGTTQDSDPVTIQVIPESCNHNETCEVGETCGGCPDDCDKPPTFSMSTYHATTGQPVTLTGYGVDMSPSWELGTGVSPQVNSLNYAFPQPGVYEVTFSGADARCGTVQTSSPQLILIEPGSGACNHNETCEPQLGETCTTCLADCDCGPCTPDAYCDEPAGETCTTCPLDCDPLPTMTLSNSAGVVGHPITFYPFGVDDEAPAWNFGNGDGAAGNPASYAYPQPGWFEVVLTGTDDRCGTTQASVPVPVWIAPEVQCPLEECEDAAIVEATSFPPSVCNPPLSATVTVRNVGTTTWTHESGYKLGALTDPNPFSTQNRVELPAGVQVAPGQSYTFTVTLDRAPAPGQWQPSWRMVREYVTWFGGVAKPTIWVEPGCGGGTPGGGAGNYHCVGTVKDGYGDPLTGRKVLLIAERFEDDRYVEEARKEVMSKPDGSFHANLVLPPNAAPISKLTCRVTPERKTRPGQPTRKFMLASPTGSALSLGSTVELDVVEAPRPNDLPHDVPGFVQRPGEPQARVGLYRTGAYDKVVVFSEPMNFYEQKTPAWTLDDLWFLFEPYLQQFRRDQVDAWIHMTPRTGHNLHEQAAELAQGIEWAARGYPASLSGGAPTFSGQVVTVGVSLGGITARLATARWDSPAAVDVQWRHDLGLTSPLPVSKMVFLDSPLKGAQASVPLQDFLWNPPPIWPLPQTPSKKGEFNLNSCAFQQLIFHTSVNGTESHDAFFLHGTDVLFPGSGLCDERTGAFCVCKKGPAVETINGTGFADVPIAAYSDGDWNVPNQCYGNDRDLTAGGVDICPDGGVLQPQPGDVMIKFRLNNYPDRDIHAWADDLVPGSRQGAPIGDFESGAVTETEAYFAGTFIPITSSLANSSGGCGPQARPFLECKTTGGYANPHVKPYPAARAWIFGHIYSGFGQAPGALAPAAQMADPEEAQPGQAVGFDGTASTDPDGNLTQHRWDFGDGTVTVGSAPSHAYTVPGVYDVRLTVTDDTGLTNTAHRRVRVGPPNQAPLAVAAQPDSGRVGQSLAFDGSDSLDPDGSVEQHFWNFGDGTFGEGPAATHVYARPGTYTVALTVTDDEQASRIAYRDVVVSEPSWQEAPVPAAPLGCAGGPRPTFSWSTLDWATHYALQVRTTAGAALLVDESDLASNAFEPAADLPPNAALRWRVRACNAMGCGAWSAEEAFTVACSAPPAPTPVAPQGCLITAQPTLSWTAVPGAGAYDVTLERVFDNSLVLSAQVAATSYPLPSPLSAFTEYRFRARALGGAWSTYRFFTTHCLPEFAGTASPLAPAGATYGVMPLFEWEAASNATDYQIEVTSPGVGAFASGWYPAATHCNAGGRCATTLSAPLIGGPTSWRIRTRNVAGLGPWSPSVSFSATGTMQSPWALVAAADFDRDGQRDLVWQDTTSGDAPARSGWTCRCVRRPA
jgi:PKD repeat protein